MFFKQILKGGIHILKIDHVGIVVRDLKAATKLYQDLFDVSITFEENRGWRSAIVKTEAGKLELMQSTDANGPLAKFAAERGEGLHHLALEVDDVQAYLDKAARLGLSLIDKKPRKGSEDMLIGFMHPKSVNGVLLEFCMPK